MGDTYIYVLLTDTGTLFTKTIKQFTKAPYNHTSLSFDENLKTLYSFGRKKPNNPFIGGFVQESLETGVFLTHPNTTCALYRIAVTTREQDKMKRILKVFIKNKNKMYYNLIGVLGAAINEQYEPQGSFFCSQFVAELFTRSGLRFWGNEPKIVTPDDFRHLPGFVLIYEGKLNDFQPIKET